jgi:hypothetical protein
MYSREWDIIYCFIIRRDAMLKELLSDPVSVNNVDSETTSIAPVPAMDESFNFDMSDNKIEASKLIANSESSLKNEAVDDPEIQLIQMVQFANKETLSALAKCYSQLSTLLSDVEVKAIITALTIQSDEMVLIKAPLVCSKKWPKLQKRILKIKNGGNYFYRKLETIMTQAEKYSFTLQVYYLCLKMGFVGEFYNRKDELEALVVNLGTLIENPLLTFPENKNPENLSVNKTEGKSDLGLSIEDYLFGSAVR